ncbi:MAG: hypothetical protein IK114_03455 [Fibrobacter sp.]|nr:hypothetical protein [Fibrobacter sp.]
MKQLLLAFLILANTIPAAMVNNLDEAQVFEWWDDGIIDGDEAREILDLLEEGNTLEACILAEVYALESCASESSVIPKEMPPKPTKRPKLKQRPSIIPHGYIEWQGRTDSLGHLESQRTELRVNFYRYSLRLGSQSLLTYKNEDSEAHFGQISTKEIHSVIPLDTLWGTALLYPLWKFRLGALLDTTMTTQVKIDFAPSKGNEMELAYWHHKHPADSIEKRSVWAQAKGTWGSFAAWWVPENKGDIPLMKLQLHHREKMEYATVAWKADAYTHGDSLPEEAHLSSTIAKSRFWGSQTIGITAHDPWKSKLTVSARTIIPLEGDSSKTRFKGSTESGPESLREIASATCISAEEQCRQKDFDFRIQSSWDIDREQLAFSGKIRTRHTQDEGFSAPLYEAKAAYAVDDFNNASVAVTIPKGTPQQELQLRNSAEVGNEYLRFSMAVTFRRTAEETLHPIHAAMKAKVLF